MVKNAVGQGPPYVAVVKNAVVRKDLLEEATRELKAAAMASNAKGH